MTQEKSYTPNQDRLSGAQTAPRYVAERHCCTVCDSQKLCTICGDQTLLACSDCRIDFQTTVYVCKKSDCRDEHERKCSACLREIREQLLAALKALIEHSPVREVLAPRESLGSLMAQADRAIESAERREV